MSRKRVMLSYQNLSELPEGFAEKCGTVVEELDLTHNCISDLRFLCNFPRLTTLILDHNKIHSHVKMHEIPNLRTLWINHNAVKNLSTFINTLARSCPNLRYLSMMNNDGAPSYFNGGTIQQHLDYRQYVISYLTKLEALDDQKVTPAERLEAERIYGLRINVLRKDSRAKSKRKSSSSNLIEDASRQSPGRRKLKQHPPEHRASLTEKPVMKRSSSSPVQSSKREPLERSATIAADPSIARTDHHSDSEQLDMVEDLQDSDDAPPTPPTLTDTLMLELASTLKDKLNQNVSYDQDINKDNISDKNVETISNTNLNNPSVLTHMYERQTSNKDTHISRALPTIPGLTDSDENSEFSSDTDSMDDSSINDNSFNDNVPMTTNLAVTNLPEFTVQTNHAKKKFPIEKASHFKTLPNPDEIVAEKEFNIKQNSEILLFGNVPAKSSSSLSPSNKHIAKADDELSSSFSDNDDWEDDNKDNKVNSQLLNSKGKADTGTSSFGTSGSNEDNLKMTRPPTVAPKPKHIVKVHKSDDAWDDSDDDDDDWDDDGDNSPDKNRIQTPKSAVISPDIHVSVKLDNVESKSETMNVKLSCPAVAPKPTQSVKVCKASSDWSAQSVKVCKASSDWSASDG